MTGRGFGKVILLGEHAVVHGRRALAGALAQGVTVSAEPAQRMRLRVPAWDVDTERDPHDAPARAVAALVATFQPSPPPCELLAETSLPARAGLGSSAALSVAIVRALGSGSLTDAEVERRAQAGEKIFHGTPSGIDAAIATRGGVGLFTRADGLTQLAAAPFLLAVGLSGRPRDTAARVADVARRLAERPAETEAALDELGALADEGRRVLDSGVVVMFGPLFDRAQELLSGLGASSPELDRLCTVARAAGASGAKLTGAGGGGAVIAVGREDVVASAWRAAGFAAFVAEVGTRNGAT